MKRAVMAVLALSCLCWAATSQEVSPGGTVITRHEEPAPSGPDVAVLSQAEMDEIEAHIEKYIGPVDSVFHEMVSDVVHIDICLVRPTPQRNYYTLVTMGMSALPMNAPEAKYSYLELYLCLPATWKLSEEDLKDEANYWPIRLLKETARFPHLYDDWLFYGHSIPNGDPAEAYAGNTGLSNVIIYQPLLFEEDLAYLGTDKGTVFFLPLIPLYENEMQYKLDHNLDMLARKWRKFGVTELLDPARVNVIDGK
jgi:hypothetical protein